MAAEVTRKAHVHTKWTSCPWDSQDGDDTNPATLLRHCRQNGWDNYIPPFFLKKGNVRLP